MSPASWAQSQLCVLSRFRLDSSRAYGLKLARLSGRHVISRILPRTPRRGAVFAPVQR